MTDGPVVTSSSFDVSGDEVGHMLAKAPTPTQASSPDLNDTRDDDGHDDPSCSSLSSEGETTVIDDDRHGSADGGRPILADAATPTKKENGSETSTARSSSGSSHGGKESVSVTKRRMIEELRTHVEDARKELETAQAVFKISQEQNFHLAQRCATLEARLCSLSRSAREEAAARDARIEELQTENDALREKCDVLHSVVDQNATVVRDLQTTVTDLGDQKTEMESHFFSQLSTLAETMEDYESKLKAKTDSIAHLQQQVVIQEQLIKRLDGEIRNLHEQRLSIQNGPNGKEGEGTEEATSTESSSNRLSDLEQENESLNERLKALSEVNKSLHGEVVDLRDRVVRLSNIEIDVVPLLEGKLEAARTTLRALERDLHKANEEKSSIEESLRREVAAAKSRKSQMEAQFLTQLMEMENKKERIVEELSKGCQEKEKTIAYFEKKTSALQEQVIQLQSQSELEEISGRGEADRLLQIKMENESKLLAQERLIQSLQNTLHEREDKSDKAADDLDTLQRTTPTKDSGA